jgi:predicted phage baseplate assembly protein
VPERFNPTLNDAPLTFAQPLPADAPASVLIVQDPRLALPAVRLQQCVGALTDGPFWDAQYDLLESNGDDRHFVAEVDDDGATHLRFGDGDLGRLPDVGTIFQAHYRLGNGPAGNVGREAIAYLVLRQGSLSADNIGPRNPMPAQGGTAPEPMAQVKLFAPGAFRSQRERAITAEDYAELAQKNPKIQRAAAELRWMGSWYEARVAVDPLGTETASPALLDAIAGSLFKYRRMGHDLAVMPAKYVPIEVSMEVCVLPDYARGAVKAELLKMFSSRRLSDSSLGFFHPDNLTFGEGVYVSRLIAAAKQVAGVDTVRLLKLVRLDESAVPRLTTTGISPWVPDSGVLPMAATEIAQLDNDPNFPENGKLEFILRGGL